MSRPSSQDLPHHARPPDAPHLLHNMSCRPSTRVAWPTGACRGVVVRFALRSLAREPNTRPIWRLAPTSKRLADLAAELDADWTELSLHGAVLLFASVAPSPGVRGANAIRRARPLRVINAIDRDLVLNVLGRTRSGLLLADSPLDLSKDFLSRELWTDDPRLERLARKRGVRKAAL